MTGSRPLDDEPVRAESYGGGPDAAWRGVDWREHQRWVETPEGPVNTVALGSGPAIVFVHGLGGSWTNWLEQLPGFAADFRVVALDLPGFGASPAPREDISIAGYAECVAAVMERLEIESATIVGNSMGGFVSAELALARPDLVERLVLVSAAGISSEELNVRPLLMLSRMSAPGAAWVASRSHTLVRRPRARRLLIGTVVRYPDRLDPAIAAEMVRGSGTEGFLDALEALAGYAIRDRLGDIACPTLVVWGEDDRIVPPRDAPEYEAAIPGARRVMYADTGHVPMLERPEHFNALLREFVAEAAPDARSDAGATAPA